MGIEAFNEACRTSVLKYTKEWQEYVTRQARWVDFGNDYKTLDVTFMESVIWAFKELHTKGLAYEGYRVLPYCWRDETPLSNHELRMDDDVYQSRQDPALTVGFRLGAEGGSPPREHCCWCGRRPLDPPVQPGRRRRAGRRVRRRRTGRGHGARG
ncbi:class I tRNA ligase family protein [Oerskovia sp. M15]